MRKFTGEERGGPGEGAEAAREPCRQVGWDRATRAKKWTGTQSWAKGDESRNRERAEVTGVLISLHAPGSSKC